VSVAVTRHGRTASNCAIGPALRYRPVPGVAWNEPEPRAMCGDPTEGGLVLVSVALGNSSPHAYRPADASGSEDPPVGAERNAEDGAAVAAELRERLVAWQAPQPDRPGLAAGPGSACRDQPRSLALAAQLLRLQLRASSRRRPKLCCARRQASSRASTSLAGKGKVRVARIAAGAASGVGFGVVVQRAVKSSEICQGHIYEESQGLDASRAGRFISGSAGIGCDDRDESQVTGVPDGGLDADLSRHADHGKCLHTRAAQRHFNRRPDEGRECQLVENRLILGRPEIRHNLSLRSVRQERRSGVTEAIDSLPPTPHPQLGNTHERHRQCDVAREIRSDAVRSRRLQDLRNVPDDFIPVRDLSEYADPGVQNESGPQDEHGGDAGRRASCRSRNRSARLAGDGIQSGRHSSLDRTGR
jgi:hypothetical protein